MADAVDKAAAKGDMKKIHLDAAEAVLSAALSLVPVRSGVLRNTLRAAGTQKSGRVRAGFARVPYAGPIHFGWTERNIIPQPFLYAALDSRRMAVLEAYSTGIAELIKKHDLD
jgi:hypothetical protein